MRAFDRHGSKNGRNIYETERETGGEEKSGCCIVIVRVKYKKMIMFVLRCGP